MFKSKEEERKVREQIDKLLALSKSPFKAEAEVALKKAKQLIMKYEIKMKKELPKLKGYNLLIYRAFLEHYGGVWGKKSMFGDIEIFEKTDEFYNKTKKDIIYSIKECKKNLEENKKFFKGLEYWYYKSFYEGLCEGLNIVKRPDNIFTESCMDYGSQLYIQNTAYEHGYLIGKYA